MIAGRRVRLPRPVRRVGRRCSTPSMVVYLFAVIGVGLFISSLATTQQQAILGAFVFMVPAMLLSGFASPIENMPDWLQMLTLANPMRYFIVIVKGVFLKDMPAAMVLDCLADGGDRGRDALGGDLAVPASGRVEASCTDG